MRDGQIIMLVGCGIMALAAVPFSTHDYVTSVGIVFIGIVVLLVGIMIDSKTPPAA
jgi:hypothetical protein